MHMYVLVQIFAINLLQAIGYIYKDVNCTAVTA